MNQFEFKGQKVAGEIAGSPDNDVWNMLIYSDIFIGQLMQQTPGSLSN